MFIRSNSYLNNHLLGFFSIVRLRVKRFIVTFWNGRHQDPTYINVYGDTRTFLFIIKLYPLQHWAIYQQLIFTNGDRLQLKICFSFTQTLTTLDLSLRKIDDNGTQHLANILQENKVLFLFSNCLFDFGLTIHLHRT